MCWRPISAPSPPSGRTDAIYRMLHDDFRATEAFRDPIAGTYYELQRR